MPHLLLSYPFMDASWCHTYCCLTCSCWCHTYCCLTCSCWCHTYCCLTCSWSLADATPTAVLPVHGCWLMPHLLLSYLFMVTGWCHTYCCLTCLWSLADATPTAVLPVHGHWLMPHLLLSYLFMVTGWCHTCCSLTFATVVGLLARTDARSCNINTQAADASTLANKNIQHLTVK